MSAFTINVLSASVNGHRVPLHTAGKSLFMSNLVMGARRQGYDVAFHEGLRPETEGPREPFWTAHQGRGRWVDGASFRAQQDAAPALQRELNAAMECEWRELGFFPDAYGVYTLETKSDVK